MALNIMQKIKPIGNFPVADAVDIEMPDGKRLSEYTPFIAVTQDEYDALVAAGTVDESKYYVIVEDSQ